MQPNNSGGWASLCVSPLLNHNQINSDNTKHLYLKTYHTFKNVHVFLVPIGISKQQGGNLVHK